MIAADRVGTVLVFPGLQNIPHPLYNQIMRTMQAVTIITEKNKRIPVQIGKNSFDPRQEMQLAVNMQIRQNNDPKAIECGGKALKRDVQLLQLNIVRIANTAAILAGEMQEQL